MIRLTAIIRRQSGPVKLRFNTGDSLEAPRRVINQLDLEEGETYTFGKISSKIETLSQELLPDIARTHLSQYSKTESEFIQFFKRKGYPESLLSKITDRLRQEGFLDDDRVARQHLERRIRRKYYGRRKLIAELRNKGIDRQKAKALLREYYPSDKEKNKAREYAQKNNDLERRKLASRLKSRGFPGSIIGEVLDKIPSN